jgi:cytochrome c oxidase subunit 1
MLYMGILYGVPRRTAEVIQNIPGSDFSLAAATPLMVLFGIFAVLAILAGLLFLLVAVGSLLIGERVSGPGDYADLVPDGGASDDEKPVHTYEMRGTFLIALVFMAVFIASYVINWYVLTELWSVGL